MSVIRLTRGDDSNALGEEIKIVLKTDMDLTGFKAVFQLGGYQQVFDDITSKELIIIIPKEESINLEVGAMEGGVKLYDANGLARTIVKDIKFMIEREVVNNVQRDNS